MPYAIRCFFCGEMHASDYWDDIDAAIERCRQKVSGLRRGDLGDWVDDTATIRCETEVPVDRTLPQEQAA